MKSPAANAASFCGIEFDWFAVDAAGAIGLFSTGEWGEIPVEVVRHAPHHQQLVAQLAVPNWGAMEIWNDFARYGLYVFDWQPYEGPTSSYPSRCPNRTGSLKTLSFNYPTC